MPARTPIIARIVADKLIALGKQIRTHRKALRISVTTAAEAAGMSRITFHRIENGEPSVTMGAYLNAMAALDINFEIVKPADLATDKPNDDRAGLIPARIRLADYPQLKLLAWQVHGTDELTPMEALGIYERNWRHVDVKAMEPREQQLVDALRLGLGDHNRNV
jgi:transcriptional regulator with XRE-family HTH domain